MDREHDNLSTTWHNNNRSILAFKENTWKETVYLYFIYFILSILKRDQFGERLFNLDMPHAGGKELNGIHDLLHMFQKIYIVNNNFHPAETLIVTTTLLALIATLIYIARARISQLNIYLKTLKIRSIVAYAISFAAAAQALDLVIIAHENHRIL